METKKRRVITRKNLPTNIPFWQTLLLIVIYHDFPPENLLARVLYMVAFIYLAIVWIGGIYLVRLEEDIDIVERVDKLYVGQFKDGLDKALKIVKKSKYDQ